MLLTIKQVHKEFGFPMKKMYELIKQGLLPYYDFGKSMHYIDRNDIENYLQKNKKIKGEFINKKQTGDKTC